MTRAWSRRRSPSVPPVLLPSLDRLATLIERVVELVDAVGGAEPAPVAEQAGPAVAPSGEELWLAFVPSPHGYRLLELRSAAPQRGGVLELDDGLYRVVRVSPSPLPGDSRRCAYVERKEPPAEDRTFDA